MNQRQSHSPFSGEKVSTTLRTEKLIIAELKPLAKGLAITITQIFYQSLFDDQDGAHESILMNLPYKYAPNQPICRQNKPEILNFAS